MNHSALFFLPGLLSELLLIYVFLKGTYIPHYKGGRAYTTTLKCFLQKSLKDVLKMLLERCFT
jgi:hypothetical protein